MAETDWKKVRGFKRLLHDGVREVTGFVEKHHRHAAGKPFDLLEALPPLAAPTRVVRVVHDGVLSLVYGSIQAVNDVTERVDDWVVDQLDESEASPRSTEDGVEPAAHRGPTGSDEPSGE